MIMNATLESYESHINASPEPLFNPWTVLQLFMIGLAILLLISTGV